MWPSTPGWPAPVYSLWSELMPFCQARGNHHHMTMKPATTRPPRQPTGMAQTGAIVVVYYLLWVGLLGFGCGAKRRGTEFDAELKTWDLDCAMVDFVFVLLIVDVCDVVERATAV